MSLLQVVSTPQPAFARFASAAADTGTDDPLLSFAGPIAGAHALIIAARGPDLLCRLLRNGCAAATSLSAAERAGVESYDLVVVPCVTSASGIGQLVQKAGRSLVPTGRFLACVQDSSGQDMGGLLVRSLRLAGFVSVQTRVCPQGLLVRADRPMTGLATALPCLVRRQA